jgi:hemolysin activation/secretion protein
VGREGARLGISASATRSTPDLSSSFIPLDLETSSQSLGLSYTRPIWRSRSENLYFRALLTSHDGETELFGVRDTSEHIRALRVGLTYDLADAWGGINQLDVELGQGLKGLGASRAGDPQLSRAAGRPDFTKLTLYAARLQSLAPGWSALAAVSAQHAFTDLLAPELFSFGGEHFGRGYDPSELVGDSGAALKLELRYTRTAASGPLTSYMAYVFYDAGVVRQRTPGGLAASETGDTAGFGFRFNMAARLTGFIEAAKPLTKPRAEDDTRTTQTYAGVSLQF